MNPRGRFAVVLLAYLWAAPVANAETVSLRCPMTSMAIEYLYDIDLAAKTVAATPVAEPLLYMVGDGTSAGWSWSTPIKMTYIKPGVFEATTTYIASGAFRFFPQADWGPDSYNYPYFTSVDVGFINANDGDKNLKYVGPAGPYKIRVDLNAKTVVH